MGARAARGGRGGEGTRAPGQFGGVERKRLRFFIPAGIALRRRWLHLSRAKSFPATDYEWGRQPPRRQMANLIGRTVPPNWKSCQASRKTTGVGRIDCIMRADFTFKSRIVYSPFPVPATPGIRSVLVTRLINDKRAPVDKYSDQIS